MGFIRTDSGCLSSVPYSFLKRFGDEPGTNPEELIAAAHASCFAMAMSAELEKSNIRAESIDVRATVSIEKNGGTWIIPDVTLAVRATVPGADMEKVEEAAQSAKTNCPVSRLLNARIDLQFSLVDRRRADSSPRV